MTLATILHAATRSALLRALRASSGHHATAARALGVTPRSMARLVATHRAAYLAAAARHGWPSRTDLAAHARAHR